MALDSIEINIDYLPKEVKTIAHLRYNEFATIHSRKTAYPYTLQAGFSWYESLEGRTWWYIINQTLCNYIVGKDDTFSTIELVDLPLIMLTELQSKLYNSSFSTCISELWRPFMKELARVITLKSSPKNSLELALKNKFKIL